MSYPKIRALFIGPNIAGQSHKYFNAGDINVQRKEKSGDYIIAIQNLGTSLLEVTGFDLIKGINSFRSPDGYNVVGDQSRSYGFNIEQLQSFPFTVPVGKLNLTSDPTGGWATSYNAIPALKVSFDGNGLSEEELHNVFNIQIIFNSNDFAYSVSTDNGRGSLNHPVLFSGAPYGSITFDRVIFEANPKGKLKWTPNSNIAYEKNIHGYISTPKIKTNNPERDEILWKNYAKKRIADTLNGVSRVTIADFIKMNDFQNNGNFNDDIPEVKRVFNRFKDPLPQYDFIWPYGDNYAFNGLRRTIDFAWDSRLNDYYRLSRKYFKWNIDKSLVLSADTAREITGNSIIAGQKRQRREWGFREKIIKGFPYFFPKYIAPSQREINPFSPSILSPCGTGPVLAGFVTVGSGIFSGIQSSANISYDFIETQKTVNSPTDLPHSHPKVPTGLIFIQDETGGIGFSLGSDVRYMDSPLIHRTNFAEAGVSYDKMHLGSTGIPKADYRQFLREGDFVIIQMGVGLKYWHPVLGNEPRYWESLFGENEFAKLQVSRKASIKIVDSAESSKPTTDKKTTKKTIVTPEGEIIEVEVEEDSRTSGRESSTTFYSKFVPPYVDNWGAYTNKASNNSMEMAINYDWFGNDTRPDIFDATAIADESAAMYLEQIVAITSAAVEGLKEGAKEGAKLGGPIGAVIGAVVGAVVSAGVTYYVYQNLFFRERYVLRSRSMRDGQFPYTEFYPIQEYHPWSTGTPIPIDNGMPYIMSDVFSVDTRERIAPVPKLITASQLRGIPEETWKWDPNLEWKIQKDYQDSVSVRKEIVSFVDPETGEREELERITELFDERNPYRVGPKNQLKEFPGIENEPITPYTANPGSQYKGQLVTIKNVRFIKPPTKEYFVAKLANNDKVKLFEQEKDNIRKELEQWIKDGNDIRNFKIKLNDIPEIQNKIPNILKDIADILEYAIPIINIAITFMETFFGGVLKDAEATGGAGSTGGTGGTGLSNPLGPVTSTAMSEAEKLANYIQTIVDKIEELINDGISGFTSETQINEFLSMKHGIDYQGFQISVDYSHEIFELAHRAIGDFNIGDMLSKMGMATIVTILDALGLSFIGKTINMIYSTIDSFKVPEVPEYNEHNNYSVSREYVYEKVTARSEFPASVDRKNGGYWWTCPTIPLTNARSHQNDANWGNPQNSDDNEGDSLYPNQDVSGTERTVFSQLVSSNKVEISVPIWDPYNFTTVFESEAQKNDHEFGRKHTYNISYIDPRYVKDLGSAYSSSYEPFAEEWKPYKYIDGTTQVKNNFEPIDPETPFSANRVYYVVDEKNVVIPIRINANTEIARYLYNVPTGSVDITGIAWQYSLGLPGMEWEREAYMMQIWPRYLSDVGLAYDKFEVSEKPDTSVVPPVLPPPPEIPETPKPPTRLPDLTLDLGDAGNPARLDCESIKEILNTRNKFKEQLETAYNWPVDRKVNELDPNSDNVHKDPVTGREVTFPSDRNRVKQLFDSMPNYPCKGMKIGDQQYVTITSQQFPGVSRTFFFTVGPNGECLCVMMQPGSDRVNTPMIQGEQSNFGDTNQQRQTQNRFGIR